MWSWSKQIKQLYSEGSRPAALHRSNPLGNTACFLWQPLSTWLVDLVNNRVYLNVQLEVRNRKSRMTGPCAFSLPAQLLGSTRHRWHSCLTSKWLTDRWISLPGDIDNLITSTAIWVHRVLLSLSYHHIDTCNPIVVAINAPDLSTSYFYQPDFGLLQTQILMNKNEITKISKQFV